MLTRLRVGNHDESRDWSIGGGFDDLPLERACGNAPDGQEGSGQRNFEFEKRFRHGPLLIVDGHNVQTGP
jgi:hypothetical protein